MDEIPIPEALGHLMNGTYPILLWGERGTGKTTLACQLHHQARSRRRQDPFVVVDCASVQESSTRAMLCGVLEGGVRVPGIFDAVGSGTLVFDDIDRAGRHLQSLVRDLLDHGGFRPDYGHERVPFHGRVLATCSAAPSPDTMVPGLYYHLYKHHLVSLCNRPDLDVVSRELLRRSAAAARRTYIEGFSTEAMNRIIRYPWPGNFAELRRAVDVAVDRCNVSAVRVIDLPPEVIGHAFIAGMTALTWQAAA